MVDKGLNSRKIGYLFSKWSEMICSDGPKSFFTILTEIQYLGLPLVHCYVWQLKPNTLKMNQLQDQLHTMIPFKAHFLRELATFISPLNMFRSMTQIISPLVMEFFLWVSPAQPKKNWAILGPRLSRLSFQAWIPMRRCICITSWGPQSRFSRSTGESVWVKHQGLKRNQPPQHNILKNEH